MGRSPTKFGLGARLAFLAIAVGAFNGAVAFAYQDKTSISHPHAHQESAMSKIPAAADEAVCHKDHRGLDLAAAESNVAATARLSSAVDAGGALIVVNVEGLRCAYCADAIEETFAERKEISAAFVSARDGTVSIVVKAGTTLDDKDIRKLIRRRGYDVSEIRRDAVHASARAAITEPE